MEHSEIWSEKESLHYIFHYKQGSYAEQFVDNVIEEQEKCFREITELLKTIPDKKIHYWLCNSRKELAEKSKFGEVNGLSSCQDGIANIYCVYNENIQCIGYHEDTHAIAYYYCDVKCDALAEGLAMYMDKKWWSMDNELCALVYLEHGRYIPLEYMIFGDFYGIDARYSYPIMGAFVGRLIEKYGIDKFLKIYAYEDDHWDTVFADIYGQTLMEAENEFIQSIKDKGYTQEQKMTAYQMLLGK